MAPFTKDFSKIGVPLRLGGPGVLAIDHQRAALLICYEQMLVFPVLASMLRHPTVIVGISNTFWFDGTHFKTDGATKVAAVVAQALKDQNIGLAAYLK